MRVLVCLNIPEKGVDLMRREGLELTKWTADLPMTRAELSERAKAHDALLSTSNYAIDASFLQKNPHLKIISQYAAGYDNIDIMEATRLGIPIANAPGAMTDATADIAFGLLLAVSRKMIYTHKKIGRGEWGHFRPQAHLGMELKGKTLGVLGLGRIGLAFAQRCQGAYGMKVLYTNRSKNQEAEERLGAVRVPLDTLLAESDIVSAHCALTDDTRETFNLPAFRKMKNSSIFLNTARGEVHNESDLITALREGELWGAGLDVTNPEPMLPNNPLLEMENVAVTPHIGSATVEARERMSVYAAKNIIAMAQGKQIPYPVNSVAREFKKVGP